MASSSTSARPKQSAPIFKLADSSLELIFQFACNDPTWESPLSDLAQGNLSRQQWKGRFSPLQIAENIETVSMRTQTLIRGMPVLWATLLDTQQCDGHVRRWNKVIALSLSNATPAISLRCYQPYEPPPLPVPEPLVREDHEPPSLPVPEPLVREDHDFQHLDDLQETEAQGEMPVVEIRKNDIMNAKNIFPQLIIPFLENHGPHFTRLHIEPSASPANVDDSKWDPLGRLPIIQTMIIRHSHTDNRTAEVLVNHFKANFVNPGSRLSYLRKLVLHPVNYSFSEIVLMLEASPQLETLSLLGLADPTWRGLLRVYQHRFEQVDSLSVTKTLKLKVPFLRNIEIAFLPGVDIMLLPLIEPHTELGAISIRAQVPPTTMNNLTGPRWELETRAFAKTLSPYLQSKLKAGNAVTIRYHITEFYSMFAIEVNAISQEGLSSMTDVSHSRNEYGARPGEVTELFKLEVTSLHKADLETIMTILYQNLFKGSHIDKELAVLGLDFDFSESEIVDEPEFWDFIASIHRVHTLYANAETINVLHDDLSSWNWDMNDKYPFPNIQNVVYLQRYTTLHYHRLQDYLSLLNDHGRQVASVHIIVDILFRAEGEPSSDDIRTEIVSALQQTIGLEKLVVTY